VPAAGRLPGICRGHRGAGQRPALPQGRRHRGAGQRPALP